MDGDEVPDSDDRETLAPAPEEEAVAARVRGSSIAERRAAKFGFNAEKISTARFRTASPLASPAAARSPCLTIPPGISPTALLDSPIMLPNSLAMPSPTTGTFPFPPYRHESSIPNSSTRDDRDKGVGSFRFKPFAGDKPLPDGSTSGNKLTEVADQAMVLDQPSMGFEFSTGFPHEATSNHCVKPSNDVKVLNNVVIDAKPVNMEMAEDVASDQYLSREPIYGEENVSHDISEGNNSEYNSSGSMARTAEDGYNWRKYGQKQVKGSEYPRSYYKCTHPNCQVKKKVERSHDGQITEIIYKGAHNHAKPQPNRRAALGPGFSFDDMSEVSEGTGACLKAEGGSVWTNIQSGSEVKLGSDGRGDRLELTSSASILTDLSDRTISTNYGKSLCAIESTETPELSSTVASHDDDEDRVTQGSMSVGGDAEDEESESKRRKKDSCLVETTLTSRAVREPRVVVQIESEVDILDDGYRWRKYGQKVVKGNPNPRSYYKCTSAGCSVRKHVERASHNLKCVITTYEGKHNHEVPAARNGNHVNSGGANTTLAAANNAQQALSLPRSSTIPKTEVQIPDLTPQFDKRPDFSNEYLQPGFPGNFCHDARFGPSSLYQMKFPPLQSTIPYASFGLNPNRVAPQHAGPLASSILPDFPMALPPNLPPPGNLSLVGFDFNSGKPVAPVQPILSGQHLQQNDIRFLRPKQEQNDDSIYDACLPLNDHTDAASFSSLSSSSTYNRIMGGFPS